MTVARERAERVRSRKQLQLSPSQLCSLNQVGRVAKGLTARAPTSCAAACSPMPLRSEPQALAEGLRWSIRITVLINLWSALHYWQAGRTCERISRPVSGCVQQFDESGSNFERQRRVTPLSSLSPTSHKFAC